MKEYSVSRRLILAAALAVTALSVPAAASAHAPAASVKCDGDYAVLTTTEAAYNGTNHIRVVVDSHTLYSVDFGDSFHSVNRVGSGYVDHSVRVVITAHDDPSGDKGWSKTFDLVTGPCKDRKPHRVAPSASIDGPVGDPLYRFHLDNRLSDVAVTFHVRYTSFVLDVVRTITTTVTAHARVTTGWKHVLGSTLMRVTARGHVLAAERSAPAGSYGPVPK